MAAKREADGTAMALRRTGGLQTFMEVAGFTVFLMLVGRLGELPLAAATLAFTINNLAWVPMWGLGTAVTAMVGQQLGRNRPELAARATCTAFSRAAGSTCWSSSPMWPRNAGLDGSMGFGNDTDTTIGVTSIQEGMRELAWKIEIPAV